MSDITLLDSRLPPKETASNSLPDGGAEAAGETHAATALATQNPFEHGAAAEDPTQQLSKANPPAGGESKITMMSTQSATHEPAPTPQTHPEEVVSAPTPEAAGQQHRQHEQETPPRLPERPIDPRVSALQAMFPDFDVTILQYVLESVNGDQDRAIDTLLGMSDPDYVSQEPAAPRPPTQEELDEQLARRLMIEEQQEEDGLWQAQQQQQQGQGRQGRQQRGANAPYDPRMQGQQQQQQGGGDTMAEFTEQFNKIADAGKKTFGSLVSKVKARMQEYDQGRQSQGSSPAAANSSQPRWNNNNNSQQYQQHEEQSYYDPNLPSPQPSPATVQGYDLTPQPSVAAAPTWPAPATRAGAAAPPAMAPGAFSSATRELSGTPPPPATSSGSPPRNIDPGKIGLLPKRPVSLLRVNEPPAVRPSDEDDDDELEYAESPFEERSHK